MNHGVIGIDSHVQTHIPKAGASKARPKYMNIVYKWYKNYWTLVNTIPH